MSKHFRTLPFLAAIFAILVAIAYIRGHHAGPGAIPTGAPPPHRAGAPIATQGPCAPNLFEHTQPSLPETMRKGLTLVCYQGYAAANSAVTRTPLWSAEHLTAQRIAQARETERVSTFFAEPSLPPEARGELADYRRSGLDRGHLSPSGDMPGLDEQHDSFSLANIAPQDAELNRGPWADLESRVRDLAQRAGDVWVVTGVLFRGERINTTPDGRVMVPSAFWKAMMVPGRGAVVFVAPNKDSGQIDKVSLQTFEQRTGIAPFPGVNPATPLLEME